MFPTSDIKYADIVWLFFLVKPYIWLVRGHVKIIE